MTTTVSKRNADGTVTDFEVTEDASILLDRIKAGERLQITDPAEGSANALAADELMHAGLIETQALVWETRVCYVLTGANPRREAVVQVIDDEVGIEANLSPDRLADKILAVLK